MNLFRCNTNNSGGGFLYVNWTRASSGKDSAPYLKYGYNTDIFTIPSGTVGGKITVNKNIKLIYNIATHAGRNNSYLLYDADNNLIESKDATYSDTSLTTVNIKAGWKFCCNSGSDAGYTTQTIWYFE